MPEMRLNTPQKSLLLIGSGLAACIGMLVLRYALFGRWYRGYLAWNLFLACIPLVIALAALK